MSDLLAGAARIAAVGALAVVAAACGSGAAPTAAGATTVKVELQEWAVLPAAGSAGAGAITFEVTNIGPDDIHEFVIVRTDLEPGALPTDATGAVVEGGQGMTVVDEIEDVAVGQTQRLAVNLTAGRYVLICNIYDETEKEAHYRLGMRTGFTINP